MSDTSLQAGLNVPCALPLKFDLEVLSSTCIKSKKPWPRVAFIEEVCFSLLLGRHCFLYNGFVNGSLYVIYSVVDTVMLKFLL